MVRTEDEIVAPGFLIARSWHGKHPGLVNTTLVESTRNDFATTPALWLSERKYYAHAAPRKQLNLYTASVYAPDTTWNAICVVGARDNDGKVRIHLYIFAVAFSCAHDYGALRTIIENATDAQPSS